MSDITVTNPGLVCVADRADGLISVDQPVTVTEPGINSGPIVQGASMAPGKGTAQPSPSDVTPAMTAQRTVEGGTASPVSPNTENTTPNTVVGQPESTQQYYRTTNVFV